MGSFFVHITRQRLQMAFGAANLKLAIVWFRQDLRLGDNPALMAAVNGYDQILPVYIHDSRPGTVGEIGEATQVWLHHSLVALNNSLESVGGTLTVLKGDPLSVLPQLCKKLQVRAVFWNRSYDPVTLERDTLVKASLEEFSPESFLSTLLFEPVKTLKADGNPYRVFTPYWKNLMGELPPVPPLPAPKKLETPAPEYVKKTLTKAIPISSIDELNLVPELAWAKDMMNQWSVGETAALKRLKTFISKDIRHYKHERDIPSVQGTSKLSPHLHFGEISPRQIVHKTFGKRRDVMALNVGEETFVKEIVWREFAHNLIYQFPHTVDEPLDKRYQNFPWATQYQASLLAWQTGQTGIPIVDAGMRELYATGWMHNRIRMVVASFLIKNLLIPWQEGERWFRHTLVDADVASNAMGWQWAAGSGADASPFFRVFNPVLQGEKFDKDGDYVRHWVPELINVPKKFVHKPWDLPSAEFGALDYPAPLVDLKISRQEALEAFATIKAAT